MLPAEASAPFVQYGDHRAVTICSKWNRQELFFGAFLDISGSLRNQGNYAILKPKSVCMGDSKNVDYRESDR